MAINLVARLSLRDNLTGPMRRVTRQMQDTERSASRLGRQTERNNGIFRRFGRTTVGMATGVGTLARGFGGLISKINPIATGFAAIGSAAAVAYGAVKIFNATVGEAMKMEQSEVVIGAMFNDKALSKQYMQMIDKIAIDSPILDSQGMYGNSKSFITASKDIGQLEKMWSLAERLSASDPAQGLEGAVFAMRELFSGDAISMIQRFEMPRKIMNEIKKLPLEKQLTALDKYFDKIGLTTHLIDEMGGTSLGMWAQVQERFQLLMRDMGKPALKAVSNFLGGVLERIEGEDMQKFANWGGKVIERMIDGLSTNSLKLYDWFTNLMNDPEFQSRTTIIGKINFVVEDISDKLRAWYDGGGKDKIIQFGSDVTQTMIAALDNSPAFFEMGGKLGSSIWQGIISGVKSSAAESPVGKVLNWSYSWTPQEQIKKGIDTAKNSWWYPKDEKSGTKPSHSGGLDRVPYDGYQPVLHKDEKVLTAQQAREDREGGGKGVSISIGQLIVQGGADMKAQAREFLDEVATLLEQEGGQMAK